MTTQARLFRFLAALVTVAIATCSFVPWASAGVRALDPDAAEPDARKALAEGHYTFCTHPPKPLSYRAQELCPIAPEIPDCAALVEACSAPKEVPSMRFAWLRALGEFFGQIGMWLLVVGIVVVLAIPIVQGLRRARRDKKVADEAPIFKDDSKTPDAAPEIMLATDAERLLRQADELAAQGKRDRALFAFLQASLRALDDRGAIRLERHRTNGEYVRACREDGARPMLRALVRDVDQVRFGGALADDAGISRARERAMAIVRALPAALLAFLVIGAGTGCVDFKQIVGGADPAETTLFADLLKRQGAEVTGSARPSRR